MQSEGTLAFWLRHEDEDWASNEDAYDFGEVLRCLKGVRYCMTYNVTDTPKAFELRRIEALIKELEGR